MALRYTEILGSNQDEVRQSTLYMTQGCLRDPGSVEGAMAPPYFGRSVNPVYLNQEVGEAYYARYITTGIPRFSDFPMAL